MSVIGNWKNNLLTMTEKKLELSVGNFHENLNVYLKTIQQIDAEGYEELIQKIKNSNYNNLPLEEQVKFFTGIITIYYSLNNDQIRYRDKYKEIIKKYIEKHPDETLEYNETLELSNLDNIMIDNVEQRMNQIEGYLINIKNLKSNKIEIDRLDQELIAATEAKEAVIQAIAEIDRKLKDDILNARGRIYGLNGDLEVTSIALEFKKHGLDLGKLIDDSELLNRAYSDAKKELDDIRETLDTALGLPNKDEIICEKYMLDVLKSNYKFNLIELIKEVNTSQNNYSLFKDSLYKIDDLLKEIKNNLKELKIKFYINPFDSIKISDYIKAFDKFKDYDIDIANIKKTMTYLTKMVRDMEKFNNKVSLSINDEVTILKETTDTVFEIVEEFKKVDESEEQNKDNDEIIYQLLQNDDVKENQVIKITLPPDNFMMSLVRQKTTGVINRVYEMIHYKETQTTIVPNLVVEKMSPLKEKTVSNMEGDDTMPELPLFEELPPFIGPQLFDERKDGDIFNNKKEKEMEIDLSDDKIINAFREHLGSEDDNLEKKTNQLSSEELFWIPKEDNKIVNLDDYKKASLVKKRSSFDNVA